MRPFSVAALVLWCCVNYIKPSGAYLGRALLVVDVQGCFLPGGALPTQLNNTDALIRQINTLRSTGQFNAVIITQDWHPRNHVSFAPAHDKEPLDTLQLSYTSSGQVCDMQHMYPEHTVPCRNANLPGKASNSSTAASRHQPAAAQPTYTVEQVLWPPHCIQHSKEAQLHPGLLIQPDDLLIRKGQEPHLDAYSAFNDNRKIKSIGLSAHLRQQNISNVVVVGVALEYCVLWSALDAADEGFDTTVVLDATAPVSSQGAADAVQQLQQAGVKVEESIWSVLHSVVCIKPHDQHCWRGTSAVLL